MTFKFIQIENMKIITHIIYPHAYTLFPKNLIDIFMILSWMTEGTHTYNPFQLKIY